MTRITTVTLEERAGQTLLVVHDLYPSKEALDEDISPSSGGLHRVVHRRHDGIQTNSVRHLRDNPSISLSRAVARWE